MQRLYVYMKQLAVCHVCFNAKFCGGCVACGGLRDFRFQIKKIVTWCNKVLWLLLSIVCLFAYFISLIQRSRYFGTDPDFQLVFINNVRRNTSSIEHNQFKKTTLPIMKSTDYKQKDSLRMNMTRNQLKSTVQCVAQFSYTLVCNRYIFSSLR